VSVTALGGLTLAAAAFALVGCGISLPVSGFRPAYPEVTSTFGNPDILDSPRVDSLQPNLHWQSFPGEHQQHLFAAIVPFVPVDLARVRDVAYELRIWTVVAGAAGPLVYERNGLTEPSHRLEIALKPDTRYYWSVRARFKLDGEPRVSEWSLVQVPCSREYGDYCARAEARNIGRIPPNNHYRFRTPEAQTARREE
jgi:hypothetical protein